MQEQATGRGKTVIISVLLFWAGYLVITIAVGFATSMLIASEVWSLIAWGFISSACLIGLSRLMLRIEKGPSTALDLRIRPASLKNFSFGFVLGVVSFVVHVGFISLFAGPPQFEWVPGVGAVIVVVFFLRFLATSCMEELGFRGYSLQRLTTIMGPWPVVVITAVVFGLSHLSYGWSLETIMLGVVPGGLLWGMSALATRGLAVPIGLHAAWNFASWTSGTRSETGLLNVVIEDDAAALTQTVGTISYWVIFLSLTLYFWWRYRQQANKPQ